MKVHFDEDNKHIFIFGNKKVGKTSFAKKLASSFGKEVVYINNENIKDFFRITNISDFILILDEINYSERYGEELTNPLRREAFKVIEVLYREDEIYLGFEVENQNQEVKTNLYGNNILHKNESIVSSEESEEIDYVKISDETREYINNLNSLMEELKYAKKLSRKYLLYSDSEIPIKIKETISEVEHKILKSLGLI